MIYYHVPGNSLREKKTPIHHTFAREKLLFNAPQIFLINECPLKFGSSRESWKNESREKECRSDRLSDWNSLMHRLVKMKTVISRSYLKGGNFLFFSRSEFMALVFFLFVVIVRLKRVRVHPSIKRWWHEHFFLSDFFLFSMLVLSEREGWPSPLLGTHTLRERNRLWTDGALSSLSRLFFVVSASMYVCFHSWVQWNPRRRVHVFLALSLAVCVYTCILIFSCRDTERKTKERDEKISPVQLIDESG